jgi:dTDP-D-glucose 4,6-dehydratase
VSNLDLAKGILKILDKPESLISFVTERLGHDKRYSINCDKIKNELGYISEIMISQKDYYRQSNGLKNGNKTKTLYKQYQLYRL